MLGLPQKQTNKPTNKTKQNKKQEQKKQNNNNNKLIKTALYTN